MSTSSAQLAADISQLHTDAGLMHNVIHGDANTTVLTNGGTVRSMANAINSITQFNLRGAWATATAYAFKDLFTNGGSVYVVLIAHTSTTISADQAAGKIGIYQGSTSDQIVVDGTTLTGFLLSSSQRVVDTMVALRGLSSTKYTRASVVGYRGVNNQGQGDFAQDSADTTSGAYVTGSIAPIASPGAPALSSSVAGALAATTYYVKYTLSTAVGETLPSAESSLAVPANSVLVGQSPAAQNGVTGYNVYVGTTTGNETKQNSTPIAIGTNWTEPTTGLIAGAALPTASTAGSLLTASAVTNGALALNQSVNGSGVTPCYIAALGTGAGGPGTYTVTGSQTVASQALTADNGTTAFVGFDGARWKRTDKVNLSVFSAGAYGDKSTDDTAPIANAFAAQKVGGTVDIPRAPGDAYIVASRTASGSVFDFSRVMNIRADGMYSALQPAAGTTVNTIILKPNPAVANIGSKWEGLALGDPYTGNRAGTNGIYVDTTVAGSNLSKMLFSRLNIMAGTGAAFLHINSPANNVNGGMYATSIENSVLKGGINLQATGDSNNAHKNLISGPNVGIYLSNTSGASLFTAMDNNITSTGGALQVDAGSRFKFLRNNCEQTTSFTGGAQYMLNISGANGTMSTPEIRGNHLGLFSNISNAGNIHLSNTIGALVSDNTILNSNASSVGIVIDANCLNTRIGPNTYGSSVGTKVVDNGTGTMGVIKIISTFANNWAASSAAPTSTPRFYKDILGTVRLHGKLANGTVTSGTTMFTLPTGFRPDQTCEFLVITYNGTTLTPGHIRVNTDGTVVIMAGQNTELHLDGIAFPAAGLADSISDL
ncbi:hypothetical protein [Ralstonia insidiosa]|uniref:Pectate lyase superfamily protein domain-containing protein n=1 Tax=Ralstonia insidiosa TaxID=190721 RepID=A0A848NTV1_9RALS|nr:hypothetical protein [Ralstonia insidiosa]NMV36769.1 hypothetical protein [Ralstonia insidiosa]